MSALWVTRARLFAPGDNVFRDSCNMTLPTEAVTPGTVIALRLTVTVGDMSSVADVRTTPVTLRAAPTVTDRKGLSTYNLSVSPVVGDPGTERDDDRVGDGARRRVPGRSANCLDVALAAAAG